MNERELVKWFAPSLKNELIKASNEVDKAETFEDLDVLRRKLSLLAEDLETCIKDMEIYDSVRQSIEESTKKE